jgi:hypothetical protein
VRDEAFVSHATDLRRLALEHTAKPSFSDATGWTGREAWRCGPKTFRRRVASLIRSIGTGAAVDVITPPGARSRWVRATDGLEPRIRLHTPRSLVAHSWTDPHALFVDAPAAFDPASRTFRRLVDAPHRFVIVRASDKRHADPDSVFALTDLVSPGTFASVVEARSLHRRDLAAFVTRRDGVVVPPTEHALTSVAAQRPGGAKRAILVSIASSGTRVDRRVALLFDTPHGLTIADSPRSCIATDTPGEEHPPALSTDDLRSLFASETAANARVLAATIARLAKGYAERIDLAARSERESVAREFARRAEILIGHGTLRICVDVLASFTLHAIPRP